MKSCNVSQACSTFCSMLAFLSALDCHTSYANALRCSMYKSTWHMSTQKPKPPPISNSRDAACSSLPLHAASTSMHCCRPNPRAISLFTFSSPSSPVSQQLAYPSSSKGCWCLPHCRTMIRHLRPQSCEADRHFQGRTASAHTAKHISSRLSCQSQWLGEP